jgi:hypothetical protein
MNLVAKLRDFARRHGSTEVSFRGRFRFNLLFLGTPFYALSLILSRGSLLHRIVPGLVQALGMTVCYTLIECGLIRLGHHRIRRPRGDR